MVIMAQFDTSTAIKDIFSARIVMFLTTQATVSYSGCSSNCRPHIHVVDLFKHFKGQHIQNCNRNLLF